MWGLLPDVSTASLANPNGTIKYDRHSFNAIVGKADLVEYYLPAFEACATQGEVEQSCIRERIAGGWGYPPVFARIGNDQHLRP